MEIHLGSGCEIRRMEKRACFKVFECLSLAVNPIICYIKCVSCYFFGGSCPQKPGQQKMSLMKQIHEKILPEVGRADLFLCKDDNFKLNARNIGELYAVKN